MSNFSDTTEDVSCLDNAGMSIFISDDRVTLSVNSHYFSCGFLTGGMYVLSTVNEMVSQVSSNLIDPITLHNRLGHVNYKKIVRLSKTHNIPLDTSIRFNRCEVCAQTKITRQLFYPVSRSTQLLDLIHSDLCDFKSFTTRGGWKYLVTFIDDFSRYCHIYLLKSKDEVFDKFKIFKNRVEN